MIVAKRYAIALVDGDAWQRCVDNIDKELVAARATWRRTNRPRVRLGHGVADCDRATHETRLKRNACLRRQVERLQRDNGVIQFAAQRSLLIRRQTRISSLS